VRLGDSFLVALGTDPNHEIVAGDTDEHAAGAEERDSAEHLALLNVVSRGERLTDPLSQLLVVGHDALLFHSRADQSAVPNELTWEKRRKRVNPA
jgi:hypothetical protein